jgi:hypothetical protein
MKPLPSHPASHHGDQPAEFRAGQEIAAARELGNAIAIVRSGPDMAARILCLACGAHQSAPIERRMGQPQLRAIFHALGWEFDAEFRPTCPTCLRRRQAFEPVRPAPKDTETSSMKTGTSQPPAPVANDNPAHLQAGTALPPGWEGRAPTMLEFRNIFSELETYFVDGAWHNGKSDVIIARELDVPHRMVQQIRVNAFGHIRNADLEQLKADAHQLREDFKTRLADLFNRLAKLEAQQPK